MKYTPEKIGYVSGKSHMVKMVPVQGAVIIYGNGHSLGDFKVFADQMKPGLDLRFKQNVLVKKCMDKVEFLSYLENTDFDFQIKELHILCHSFGAGLALGYGLEELETRRYNVRLILGSCNYSG